MLYLRLRSRKREAASTRIRICLKTQIFFSIFKNLSFYTIAISKRFCPTTQIRKHDIDLKMITTYLGSKVTPPGTCMSWYNPKSSRSCLSSSPSLSRLFRLAFDIWSERYRIIFSLLLTFSYILASPLLLRFSLQLTISQTALKSGNSPKSGRALSRPITCCSNFPLYALEIFI